MRSKAKVILVLLLPFLFYIGIGFSQSKNHSTHKKTIEERILDTVMNIPEVKEEAKYVETESHGKRHLSLFINLKPSKTFRYYWIKVWEDNGYSFVTHFHFYVDPKTLSIKFLDTSTNNAIDLNVWQKSRKKH
jgi:hypothetical protein